MSQSDVKRREFTSQDIKLITKLECIQVIRQTLDLDEAEVIDYSIENAGREVLGFLGEYYRLKITIKNETGELTNNYYFVKSMPYKNQMRMDMMNRMGLFKKEMLIYRDIFPDMKGKIGESKWRPYSYLIRDDFFILEELRHAGYRHVPDRIPFNDEHIYIVLKAVARMHAASFDYEKNILNNKTFYEKFKEIFFETLIPENGWLNAGMKATEAAALNHPKYGKIYKDKIENDLVKILCGIFDLLNPSEKYKNVFTHRDMWANNLMFKYYDSDNTKPEYCLILDYQNCRYSPPALDFMIFIYFNTRRDKREQNLKYYQDFYFLQLESEMEKLKLNLNEYFDKIEFLESCELYKFIPIVLNTIYIQLTHLPVGFLNDLQKSNLDEYNQIVDIDRNDFVVEQMKKDPYYRECLNEAISELIENYLIEK